MKKWLIPLILIFSFVLSASASAAPPDYDALLADYENLKAEYDTLLADHEQLKEDYAALEWYVALLLGSGTGEAAAEEAPAFVNQPVYVEGGAPALVETEYGNYYFTVTAAKIHPADEYGPALYHITWIAENESFVNKSGNGMTIAPNVVEVYDSNGYLCRHMSDLLNEKNLNQTVPVGRKVITLAAFEIVDPAAEYLEVCIPDRNIIARIDVNA